MVNVRVMGRQLHACSAALHPQRPCMLPSGSCFLNESEYQLVHVLPAGACCRYVHLQCLQAMTDTIRGRRPSSSTMPEPLLSHTSKQQLSHLEFHSNPLLTVARTATGNS